MTRAVLKRYTKNRLAYLLRCIPHEAEIRVRWKENGGDNGQVKLQDGILYIELSPDLLKPSENTCRQAIAHVLIHELAHAIDWNGLQSVSSRRAHDEHWGIEYARVYRERVAE